VLGGWACCGEGSRSALIWDLESAIGRAGSLEQGARSGEAGPVALDALTRCASASLSLGLRAECLPEFGFVGGIEHTFAARFIEKSADGSHELDVGCGGMLRGEGEHEDMTGLSIQ
jgi:hypothetical protein